MPSKPEIDNYRGYQIIKTHEGYKVYDSDNQYGPSFKTKADAEDHIDTLPNRELPR